MNIPEIGNLYFLQVDGGGPIKIGWTYGSVAARARVLQQSSPYLLHWIGACRAPKSDEAAAHALLATDRLRGEWFYPTERVRSFVKDRTGEFDERAYLREHFRFDLKERFDKLQKHKRTGTTRWIAKASKIDYWTISSWKERTRLLTEEQYQRLETAISRAERGEHLAEVAA